MNYCMSGKKKTVSLIIIGLLVILMGRMFYGSRRAENIVRNNLCLFFEDGKASCAYTYPNRVNGVKAGFYDPYANDQDWAFVYYLLVNKDIY